MSVTERTIHVGLLVSAVAVCAWVFGAQHGAQHAAESASLEQEVPSEQRSPLAIIPPGSAFLLTADVRQLEHAPLGALLAQRLGNASGTAKLSALCGFDPLSRLDQLALAVPSAELTAQAHPEDFGIVATGRFSAAEITRCASAAIGARGGDAIETKLGKFSSVRDRKTSGEVAAKDGGLLIVSGGSYFRELLDTAEGHTDSRREPPDLRHVELRRALGPGSLVATWLLGEHWFERVSGDDTNARLSPLGALRAVGARIDVSEAAHVLLIFDCADSEGAARIANLLSELRSSLRGMPLDPALAALALRVSVSQTGARLKLAVDPEPGELTSLLGLLLGP